MFPDFTKLSHPRHTPVTVGSYRALNATTEGYSEMSVQSKSPSQSFKRATAQRGASTAEAIAGLVIMGLVAVSGLAYQHGTCCENVTFTVNKAERVVKDDSSKYLIFTDKGVYENTDALWHWKWNSSDIYNKIAAGKTYEARTYGWRMPFFSTYPNILDVKELPSKYAAPAGIPTQAKSIDINLNGDCASPNTISQMQALQKQGFKVTCNTAAPQ